MSVPRTVSEIFSIK